MAEKEEMDVLVGDVIQRFCHQEMSGAFLVGANISDRKRNNARQSHDLHVHEPILGLVDATVFGTAKYGAVFTPHRLSVRNRWFDDVKAWDVTWSDFVYATIEQDGEYTVLVNGLDIGLSGSSMEPDTFVVLLRRLQLQLKAYMSGERIEESLEPSRLDIPSREEEVTWMVARAGETFGPFTEAQVIEAVIKGRFDRTTDYVWKAGMPDWRRIEDVDVFRQQTPPPLPTNDELPPLPGGVPPLPKKHRP